MGIYIYSVRTKELKVQIPERGMTKVYPLQFLTRAEWSTWGDGLSGFCQRLVNQAETVWNRRPYCPGHVVLVGDKGPSVGDPVFSWDGRVWDYDTPDFQGKLALLGFLKKVRGKWCVVKECWSVRAGKMQNNCFHVTASCYPLWSKEDAEVWVRANRVNTDAEHHTIQHHQAQ
jgi:hypothetical protein